MAEAVKRIEESETVLEENRKLLLDYKRGMVLRDLAPATISKNLNRRRILAEQPAKSLSAKWRMMSPELIRPRQATPIKQTDTDRSICGETITAAPVASRRFNRPTLILSYLEVWQDRTS